MELSNFESPLKRELDLIRNSATFRVAEQMQAMMDRHLRPFEEMRQHMNEITRPFDEIRRRVETGAVDRLVEDIRASARISQMEKLREQLEFRNPLRHLKDAARWAETLRPIELPPAYSNPLILPPIAFRDPRDAKIEGLEDRIDELEARVDELEGEENQPSPDEEDDRPFPGQYL